MICMIKATLSSGLQFISHLSKPYLFRPVQEDRALEMGQKITLREFFKLNEQDDTAHQYFTMKFLNILLLPSRKFGSEDDKIFSQSLVEFTRFNHLIQEDLLFAYSCYIEKELNHLRTSEQLMVVCMTNSKMQQEQWDC